MILGRIPLGTVRQLRAGAPVTSSTEIGGPDEPRLPPQQEPTRFTGFVIVRLVATVRAPNDEQFQRLTELAKGADLRDLSRVLETFKLGPGSRLIRSLSVREIREKEALARRSWLPPVHSLTDYWRLDLRGQIHRMADAVEALNAVPEVDAAYPELKGKDPAACTNPANNPYSGQQRYLDAAPSGIDARWAWTQPNGCGKGIAVVDMEEGWILPHDDYAAKAPTVIVGDNRDGVGGHVGDHGAAVLGIMVADDNNLGIVGIAPLAGPVRCASRYDAPTDTSTHVADAITGALNWLSVGDVLVVEFETVTYEPAEYADENFDAIRLASAIGIVVIEAAGNYKFNNLDTLLKNGRHIFNPTYPDEFRESGALLVGSADPVTRDQASTYGLRVNCFGWDAFVVTCGYGDLAGTYKSNTYTKQMGGTSAATAIVAGAALIVQGWVQANVGTRLSPQQMRFILSDPDPSAGNTGQGGGGHIGVMPNLRAIVDTRLALTSDVYLRDEVGDDGSVPSNVGLSASPDIIVRPSKVADEAAEFGEGSGTEENNSLGFPVEAGQDNFIYVRMKNRGAADAADVTARLFWSEVATLVTPDLWTEIGVTGPVDVPRGDTLVVTEPLTWPSADIPGSGHYCFVGILDHATDPAPPTPPATDWDGFRAFIRNQNNVAWRNFNVVDEIGAPGVGDYEASFLLTNAPDTMRVFDFVIEQRIARELRVALEVPLEILEPFTDGGRVTVEVDRENRFGRIELPHAQRLTVPRVALPAAARFRSRFIVRDVATRGVPGNQISIHQYFEEQQVGRITWRFLRKRGPGPENSNR
jgi:serine protease